MSYLRFAFSFSIILRKKILRYKCFTSFAVAFLQRVTHGYRVNALPTRDKIKGAKGNLEESGRGRMMKYEIFVSRDGAIYPLV